jgi:pantoate--beta-alanine ligase
MTAEIVLTRHALRDALGAVRPGLVPTMGALHAGHRALIARSAQENPLTVVSIFVNPAQFTNPADLDRYPRDIQHDQEAAADAGADIIFAPEASDIYPPGFDTTVEVGALSQRWEGASRSGHFRGVATVVTILLNLTQPARSYFGEKDYQQLQIVRRFHRDLALPGDIVGCPTVRDADGLALSSRNARLSEQDRLQAIAIPRAISRAQAAATAGETGAAVLEGLARAELARPGIELDYAAVVDGDSLEPAAQLRPGARILIAAAVGGIRLIDNDAILPAEAPAACAIAEPYPCR